MERLQLCMSSTLCSFVTCFFGVLDKMFFRRGGRGGEGKAREEVVAVVTVMEANYRLARAIYYR